MTTAALPLPGAAVHPVSMPGAGAHPVSLAAEVERVLDAAGVPEVSELGGRVLAEAVRAWDRVESRVRALKLTLVAAAAGGGAPVRGAAPSPVAWLASVTGADPGAARAALAQADALAGAAADPGAAELVAGALSGAVGVGQAVQAAHALAALPSDLPAAVRARSVELVRDAARSMAPGGVRAFGERVLAQADPVDGARRLAAVREQQVRRARALRSLVIGSPVDGLVTGRFALPTLEAATVTTALRALAAPRPASDPGDDPGPGHVPGADGATDPAARTGALPAADGADGRPRGGGAPGGLMTDPRTAAQRMADALVELAEHDLARGALPDTGGERPQLVVTLDWTVLRDLSGEATTADGHGTSPGQARRLACDAGVLPGVLAGPSQPLDIGRATRTVPAGMRRALVLRDRGCAFPDCGRPAAWTDAHHIRHWADGGPTALSNLVLLCGHHHRTVHATRWRVTTDPATGRPVFHPPRPGPD